MQNFSEKNSGPFSGWAESNYKMGRHTKSAMMKYQQSQRWDNVPEEDCYYLTVLYPVNGLTELNTVRKNGQAMHYVTIAKELGISKGQLCNLAEKHGCIKRNDTIQTNNKENIDALMEALLPWVMAMHIKEMQN